MEKKAYEICIRGALAAQSQWFFQGYDLMQVAKVRASVPVGVRVIHPSTRPTHGSKKVDLVVMHL